MIHHGDCIEVMATFDAESVDAIVTDPPYDLTSTGARNGSPRSNAGTGPYARLDRGGFMGKAWDGTGIAFRPETWAACLRVARPGSYLLAFGGTRTFHRMTCAIEDAGWIIRDCLVWAYASGFPKSKASLKPAWEPIVMARKPGPLRDLAIDACRIGLADDDVKHGGFGGAPIGMGGTPGAGAEWVNRTDGRWPANVVLTDPIFDGDMPGVVGGGGPRGASASETDAYSRFFLIPKAARSDREPVLSGSGDGERANVHPTVKPTALMRHLVRLVTPPGGIMLDPFLGSGSTALAAEIEGFGWVGIEREAEYVAIAEARLNGTQRGLGLAEVVV